MERYFILDKYNTWYDWGLLLTSKETPEPELKTNYVEIDGMSGSLDLSESLTGEITYKDRTVSATFWTDKGTRKDREKLLRDIRIALHGKKIKIIEPDDPDHYFIGRVSIKSHRNIISYLEFTIEAICDPWRYAIDETVRMITLGVYPIGVIINNHGVKTLCPIITISDPQGALLTYDTGAKGLYEPGDYIISDLKLKPGPNEIMIKGKGTVSFKYREADI